MRTSVVRRVVEAWRVGAAALFGPLAVLATAFLTTWGVVAVALAVAGRTPWGARSAGSALIVALIISPWLVKRGWLDRD